jgi:hypothetical protein
MESTGDTNSDMTPHERRIPVGVWIRLELPRLHDFVGFTYVDPSAGFSAKGAQVRSGVFQEESIVTVRLSQMNIKWETLGDAEIAELGLETRPSWVEEFYGPQPEAGTPWGWWQDHPQLKGRFHTEYPDDLQVIVHDGGPRVSDLRPELVWVRVIGGQGEVFVGHILNEPHQLQSVSQGALIKFVVPDGCEYPLMVTDKYLSERPDWIIDPCQNCGLSELFDAPSDLLRIVFLDMPDDCVVEMFSAFCGACGGVQVVQHKNYNADESEPEEPPPKKGWWQFWK